METVTVTLTITTHPSEDTNVSVTFHPPVKKPAEPSLAETLGCVAIRAVVDWCNAEKRRIADLEVGQAIGFVDRINQGNPDFRPYNIPEHRNAS